MDRKNVHSRAYHKALSVGKGMGKTREEAKQFARQEAGRAVQDIPDVD